MITLTFSLFISKGRTRNFVKQESQQYLPACSMLIFPNAKINLGLYITERRADGYHNLESCFYPIDWSDLLEVIPIESPAEQPSISFSGLPVPGDPLANLCMKAYKLLRQDYALPPVKIHLHKNIPIGAGLGGGSADAAFTLRLLNEQFRLSIPTEQLEAYARQLGSDCAFFIQNQPIYCTEKGDVFEEINLSLKGYSLLLVYPNLAISTQEAYAGVRPRKPATSLKTQLQTPITAWRETVYNQFEESLFPLYPILSEVKTQLYQLGAIYASMSGSGSTLYGIFDQLPELPNHFKGYRVWQSVC